METNISPYNSHNFKSISHKLCKVLNFLLSMSSVINRSKKQNVIYCINRLYRVSLSQENSESTLRYRITVRPIELCKTSDKLMTLAGALDKTSMFCFMHGIRHTNQQDAKILTN